MRLSPRIPQRTNYRVTMLGNEWSGSELWKMQQLRPAGVGRPDFVKQEWSAMSQRPLVLPILVDSVTMMDTQFLSGVRRRTALPSSRTAVWLPDFAPYDISLDIPPLGHIPSEHFSRPDIFLTQLGHIQPDVKAKIWKLALTHTLDPNRPTTWGHNPNPNRPTGRGIFWKQTLAHRGLFLTLTDLPLSILYTLTVSLYIVDWRVVVVVEGGKCPTPCKKRRGDCRGGGNVRIPITHCRPSTWLRIVDFSDN